MPKTAKPSSLACKAIYEMISTLEAPDLVHNITDEAQLYQLWAIDGEAYDECCLSFEAFKQWWENYQLGLVVVSRNSRIAAAMGIFPIAQAQYELFVRGELPEGKLLPVSLPNPDESLQYYWYFSGIVVEPKLRGTKAAPLKLLLSSGLGQWFSGEFMGYPSQCCSMGYSPEGERLLAKFGFQKQANTVPPDECPIYTRQFSSPNEVLQLMRSRGLIYS